MCFDLIHAKTIYYIYVFIILILALCYIDLFKHITFIAVFWGDKWEDQSIACLKYCRKKHFLNPYRNSPQDGILECKTYLILRLRLNTSNVPSTIQTTNGLKTHEQININPLMSHASRLLTVRNLNMMTSFNKITNANKINKELEFLSMKCVLTSSSNLLILKTRRCRHFARQSNG